MARETWNGNWQEGAFGRIRGYVGSSPAWYENLSPSDVADDAYLLGIASTLFLRDEDSGAKAKGPARTGERMPPRAPARPLGVPPFTYERCLAAGGPRRPPPSPRPPPGARCAAPGSRQRVPPRRKPGRRPFLPCAEAGALRTEWPSDESRCDPPWRPSARISRPAPAPS